MHHNKSCLKYPLASLLLQETKFKYKNSRNKSMKSMEENPIPDPYSLMELFFSGIQTNEHYYFLLQRIVITKDPTQRTIR